MISSLRFAGNPCHDRLLSNGQFRGNDEWQPTGCMLHKYSERCVSSPFTFLVEYAWVFKDFFHKTIAAQCRSTSISSVRSFGLVAPMVTRVHWLQKSFQGDNAVYEKQAVL